MAAEEKWKYLKKEEQKVNEEYSKRHKKPHGIYLPYV